MRPIHVVGPLLLLSCSPAGMEPPPTIQITSTGPHQWAVSVLPDLIWALEGEVPRVTGLELAGLQLLECPAGCDQAIFAAGERVFPLATSAPRFTIEADSVLIETHSEIPGTGTLQGAYRIDTIGVSFEGGLLLSHHSDLDGIYGQVIRGEMWPTGPWGFRMISDSGLTSLMGILDGNSSDQRGQGVESARGDTGCLLSMGAAGEQDLTLVSHGMAPASAWESILTGAMIEIRREISPGGSFPAGTTFNWSHFTEISDRCP